MQTIELERSQALRKNLMLATSPSATPDDNFRPTHWCDRMYYAMVRTGLGHLCSSFAWSGSPLLVASSIIAKCVNGPREWFTPLETTVAAMLAERGLQPEK